MQNRCNNASAGGFTLVELLAAMTLLAVLLVLMSGALQTVRRSSQAATCLNNLRSLGATVLAHAADHNATLLPRRTPEERWTKTLTKGGYLPSSSRESGLMACPAGPRSEDDTECYGMRAWGSHEPRMLVAADAPLPLRLIKEPSRFFLIADSIKYGDGRPSQWYTIQPKGKKNAVHLRHQGKGHAVFADGHVAAEDRDYFETGHFREPNLVRVQDGPEAVAGHP